MTLRFAEVRMNDPDAASMRARCEERAAALWRLTDDQARAGPDDENAALDRLPAEHRAAVWRSYYLVWMTAQIADDRHIADGTEKVTAALRTASATAHTAGNGGHTR
jgi:DNA-directed RNA polymerase specialized sigma24 family protein